MSAIQGFPSNQKVPLGTGITNNFTTVIPTDPNRAGLDVLRFAFRVNDPLNARVAGAGTGIENVDGVNLFWVDDTSTPARPGDFVRFEDGPAAFLEIPIVKVETNRFLLAVNSGNFLPVATNTFFIMRYATQRVDDTGSQVVIASPGPTQFVLDGLDVEVEEDTAVPANNKPLPTKLFDSINNPVNPASIESVQAVETAVSTLDTNIQAIDFATEAKQDTIITSLGTLATEATLQTIQTDTAAIAAVDFATEATLALIEAKVLTDTQLRASPVPVSLSSIPLATGAATEAKQDDEIAELVALNAKDFATETTLALIEAKDFATEATLAAMSSKLPATLGQKTSANSMAVVIASDQSAIPVSASQVSNTGTFAQITNLVATAQTFTAPANAVGFKIQAPSTNTENIAFSIGATATITAGILMEPGRSEDFDAGSNISVIATSATQQTVNVIWKVRP